MSTLSIRDIGLRTSVTPRATDISDRIAAAVAAGGTLERLARLKEWQDVINWCFAWQKDLDADEHAAWLELLAVPNPTLRGNE